jgi:hypothetical protein
MIHVRDVTPLQGHRLALTFSDGTSGEVDFEPFLAREFFAPLRDEALFAEAFIDGGTVAWPGNLDIAPEALYARAHGLVHATTSEQADANELAVSLRQVRRHALSDAREGFEMVGLTEEQRAKIERGEERDVDMLRRYAGALGGELEVVVRIAGEHIALHGVGERSRGYGYVAPAEDAAPTRET